MGYFRNYTLLLATVAMISRICAAETPPPLFQSSATESMVIQIDPETNNPVTRHIAVNYHQLYLTMPEDRELIARETILNEYAENTEGGSTTATVELFYRKPDRSYPALPDHTSTVSEAAKIKFNADHWAATTLNCCDAEPFLQLYAYGESKPFLYTNTRYAEIILPNAGVTRYIGVMLRSQTHLVEPEQAIFGNNDKAMAAVLYATPGKPLQKLLLEPKPGMSETEVPYHTLDLNLKSKSAKDEDSYNDDDNISKVMTMWSQDTVPGQPAPKSVSGFSIIASFSGNDGNRETVTIPVDKDKFGTPKLSGQTLHVLKVK